MRIIMSERNKELDVVNGYKRRFVGVRKCDQLLKWRCSSEKNCTAFIFSNLEKKIVDSKGIHNHPADTPNKIEKQVLRENCKRSAGAEESVSSKPITIIRTELLSKLQNHRQSDTV